MMSRDQRAALPYMHPGRVDVIGAGVLVWRRVLERVGADSPGAAVVTSGTTSSTASPCRSPAEPAPTKSRGSKSRAPRPRARDLLLATGIEPATASDGQHGSPALDNGSSRLH